MPIDIREYDSSGNLLYTEIGRIMPEELIVYDVNKNNIARNNVSIDLNGNTYSFVGSPNLVTIDASGAISIKDGIIGIDDTTIKLTEIIDDYGFSSSARWTINNTYPGTNSGVISGGTLELLMDDTVGYNEWRITSIDKYPTNDTVMTIDWSFETGSVEGSSPPQVVDVYLGDKSNNYHLLVSDIVTDGTYSGTITLTEQPINSVSPQLRVYVTAPTNNTYKIIFSSFRLRLRTPAVKVKNLESKSIVATDTVSIAPTTNVLSTSVSELGRVFVKSSDKMIYYRPAQSSTDYPLIENYSSGAGSVEFEFGSDSLSSPLSGKFTANSNSVGSITSIYISDNNVYSVDVSSWAAIIDTNLTATRNGVIQIINKTDSSVVGLYSIYSIFDSSGYWQISLNSPIISNGNLTIGEKYLISYLFDGADAGGGITKGESIALSIALG
jgi:hypothetical protein